MDNFYELLGVNRNASQEEIKSAFRKQAVKLHPDKGGNAAEFQKINEAYETLKDPAKKSAYDARQSGKQHFFQGFGPFGGFPGNFNMGGFENSFFHNMTAQPPPETVQVPNNIEMVVKISFQELFLGKPKVTEVQRKRKCTRCSGVGGIHLEDCSYCGSRGFFMDRVINGGVISTLLRNCHGCKGRGKIIPKDMTCSLCEGARICTETHKVQVPMPSMNKLKEKLILSQEGNQTIRPRSGKVDSSDLVLQFKIIKHPAFAILKNHLVMKRQITLKEALTGFKFSFTQLDGRTLYIRSQKGHVYKPGEVQIVPGEGFPEKNNGKRGHLMMMFDVVFPEDADITDEIRESLSKVLPDQVIAPEEPKKEEDIQEVLSSDDEDTDTDISSEESDSE